MKKNLLAIIVICVAAVLALVGCSASAETSTPAPKVVVADDKPAEGSQQKFTLPTEPYYVLIIGNDSRNNTIESKGDNDPGRADTTMIARIDPTTYQISLLTIPRDTPIEVDGQTQKINSEYKRRGNEGYMGSISDFTGLNISYYLDLGMPQFVDFFNAIGGVDANVQADMTLKDITTGKKISLKAGEQHLNGNQALVLSRVRKVFYWGDPIRQYSSRHMIETTILKCANDPELATKNLDILLEHAETNWPAGSLALQIADFCEHADEISFLEGNGPYDGSMREELNDWFCYEDPETWEALIKVFSEGDDPQTVLPLPPAD